MFIFEGIIVELHFILKSTIMQINEDKLEAFWQWFVKNSTIIKQVIEHNDTNQSERIVEELNNFILDFGMFTWDIGQNEDNVWFFLISPNGDPELLLMSQRIMADAPSHLEWLFLSSRPSKSWDRQFSIYNNEMDLIQIDGTYWSYLAFEEDNGQIELVFEAQNIAHLDEETAEFAVNQFLVNELGEKERILKISSVTVVPIIDEEDQEDKYPIDLIRSHLGIE